MGDLLDRLLQLLRDNGWPELVRQAAPLLDNQAAETALAVAAALTQADHVESSEEQSFLESLSQALTLDPARAAQIVEVVAVLNRDSLAS
jgi:tellurite resistance protein